MAWGKAVRTCGGHGAPKGSPEPARDGALHSQGTGKGLAVGAKLRYARLRTDEEAKMR